MRDAYGAATFGALLLLALTGAHCSLTTDLNGFSEPAAAVLVGAEASVEGGVDAGSEAAAPTSYSAVVMTDAPIAYWRLGESSAPTAKDEVPAGHPGTYKGGVVLGVPGSIAGDPDTAAHFDGVDDVMEIALPSKFDFAGKAPFSVEAWVKLDAMTLGVLGKDTYSAQTDYLGWFIAVTDKGSLTFHRGKEGALLPTPAVGRLFHLVGTFDGFTIVIYIDGVQAADATSAIDLTATGVPLQLGRVESWGTHTGTLDEVAIYDKALSPARIRAHFQAGTNKP